MDADDTILYEFLTFAEWPQEPEIVFKGLPAHDHDDFGKRISSSKSSWWSFFSAFSGYIPLQLSRLINNQLSWQFSVGGNGKVLAILQDCCIEIRSSKDSYTTVVGKCYVSKDSFPQWRKLVWSPDCTLLALSYSDGSLDCFDALGSKLFSIPSGNSSTDLTEALVAINFVDVRVQKTNWSTELILINYKGSLRSYFVSALDGFEEHHTFNFSNYLPMGVTSATYHPTHNLLLVSGSVPSSNIESQTICTARENGIFAWRVLNDFPYYRLSLTLEEERQLTASSPRLFRRTVSRFWTLKDKPDAVFKLSLSPDSSLLSAIHLSGALSIWQLPSLRLQRMWSLEEQPSYNSENVLLDSSCKSSNRPLKYHLADLNWWSDVAVILSRYSGAMTVSSIHNLNNLLGSAVEWFGPQPLVSSSFEGGFLVLECENEFVKKRKLVPSNIESSEDNEDLQLQQSRSQNSLCENGEPDKAVESSDEDLTVMQQTSKYIKTALYYITDNEKFQPPRKKPKVLRKTYRLLYLKSRTPEELFARKLDDEEYGEAISLALKYNLDCDQVYLRQWRNSRVSLNSIQDYLAKITKRSWVLNECLERVPEDIETARALLNYGLRGTDLDVLLRIQQGTDDGIHCVGGQGSSDLDYDRSVAHDNADHRSQCQADPLLALVKFSHLNGEQKKLCRIRQKLLKYLDRLSTYEIVLGGPAVADEYFDYNFFHKFRSQSAVEAAIEFAHENNWQFIAALFTYHGDELLPHWLAILMHFPETISPFEYKTLLPECGYDRDSLIVYPWVQERSRYQDWVFSSTYRRGLGHATAIDSFSFDDDTYPELKKYCCKHMTPELLTDWYTERAIEIDRRSRLVSHSLDLIILGMERNVQGLERLHDDLITMDVLVYECYVDVGVTVEDLRAMPNIKKIQLLMSTSTEETFVKNVRRLLIPFLNRCMKHDSGSWQELLQSYLVSLAVSDLSLCVKLFQESRSDLTDPVISSVHLLLNLALDCIYGCEETTQLNNALAIVECLPRRGFGERTEEMEGLHDKLDALERQLRAVGILEQYGVKKTATFMRNCQNSEADAKQLLTLLTRVASRREPPLDAGQWKELFEDVLELQAEVLNCVSVDTCAEIFAAGLLCSGHKENIHLAKGLFKYVNDNIPGSKDHMLWSSLPRQHRISSEKAVELVTSAATEYFNSSSSLQDPIMGLAKECLKLGPTPNNVIEAEIDLIDALPVLNYFGVNYLPFQVRMCKNRLDLIKEVFKVMPDAYKESQKLLTLAHRLRIGQDYKSWERQVYFLIASAALQAKDCIACYRACQRLVDQGYSEGWEVCFQLGCCRHFEDVAARHELLAFASIHCDKNTLQQIVSVQHELEMDLLRRKLQSYLDVVAVQENDSTDANKSEMIEADELPFGKASKLTAHLQRITGDATKLFLSIGKSELWQHGVSLLHRPSYPEVRHSVEDFRTSNTDFTKISVPEWYASALTGTLPSPLMPQYTSYASPDESELSLNIGFLLLHIGLIENSASISKDLLGPYHAVLQQIASYLLPNDVVFGLAHLLALDDPDLVDECFQKLPLSELCLQLALYTFGLFVCRLAELVEKRKLYTCKVAVVIKTAIRYAQSKTKAQKCEKKLSRYCELLLQYENKRADYVQGKLLQSLGKGINVQRFSQDDEYKRETILNLIMTVEDKQYKAAISLAKKYKVPPWDSYMSHLEYLFSHEDLAPSDIEKRVSSLGLLPVLLQEPEKFIATMSSKVVAVLNGQDHARLLYYYSLLEQCSPKDKKYHANIVLLRKLQSFSAGLDYKLAVSGSCDVLELLTPSLSAENVHVFAKLTTQISKCCKQVIESSNVYRAWIVKLFFEREPKSPTSHPAWISRYNLCKEYFDKLGPEDLVKFVQETLFTERALDEVSRNTRKDLLSRTLRYAKGELSKAKEGSNQCTSWKETVNCFEELVRHMLWMESDYIESLLLSDKKAVATAIRKLEMSQSRPDRIKDMLLQCVLDGNSLETLQELISICPPELCEPPSDIIIDAVNILQKKLRNPEDVTHHLLQNRDAVSVLNIVVEVLIKHTKEGGDVIDLNDVAAQLQPLCAEDSVAVQVKLAVIGILEQIYDGSHEDLADLSFFKTGAIIQNSWPELKIAREEVDSQESKTQMLSRLLLQCSSLDQAITISDLIKSWPSLPTFSNKHPEENLWWRLLTFVLQSPDENRLDVAIRILKSTVNNCQISLECLEHILRLVMEQKSLLQSLKFALSTDYSKLHDIAIAEVKKLEKLDNYSIDDDVCSLLITRRLVSLIVPTVLYKPLLSYISEHSSVEEIRDIVTDLKQNGFICEAASLWISNSGIPVNLMTFNSALHVVNRL